jgi:hypothetical protein
MPHFTHSVQCTFWQFDTTIEDNKVYQICFVTTKNLTGVEIHNTTFTSMTKIDDFESESTFENAINISTTTLISKQIISWEQAEKLDNNIVFEIKGTLVNVKCSDDKSITLKIADDACNIEICRNWSPNAFSAVSNGVDYNEILKNLNESIGKRFLVKLKLRKKRDKNDQMKSLYAIMCLSNIKEVI